MKLESSINLLTFRDDTMARVYLNMNCIVGAFTFHNGPREWEVLEGKPDDLCGFKAAVFSNRKEANAFRDTINARIAELNATK